MQDTRIKREKGTFGELSGSECKRICHIRDMTVTLGLRSNNQPTLAKPPHPILWRHRLGLEWRILITMARSIPSPSHTEQVSIIFSSISLLPVDLQLAQ